MTTIKRVLAPNPGPYTGPGTNSYVVGDGASAIVIDPGPVIAEHLDAIVATIGDAQPAAILVTHTHPDHAPAANPLGERLGVPVLGHSPGPSFAPDRRLADGDSVAGDTFSITAVHTPGHTPDHLCFLIGDVLFTGDHIMSGSSVVIEDAAAYMASLERVLELGPRHLHPGHGAEIPDAAAAIRQYIDHRNAREFQIVDAVAAGAHTITSLVEAVYADVDPVLIPAATQQVVVQLTKLESEGRVRWRRRGADESDGITLAEE